MRRPRRQPTRPLEPEGARSVEVDKVEGSIAEAVEVEVAAGGLQVPMVAELLALVHAGICKLPNDFGHAQRVPPGTRRTLFGDPRGRIRFQVMPRYDEFATSLANASTTP